LLIFGLGQRYRSNAGIPLQWDRFETYGVVCNPDDAGSYEYISGVCVSEFPDDPAEFSRLRIPLEGFEIWVPIV
jgi:AraC family transcriptional regulator